MTACKHTPCPTGYVAWHEWATKKAKTHRPERCPVCGRYAIWKPRRQGRDDVTELQAIRDALSLDEVMFSDSYPAALAELDAAERIIQAAREFRARQGSSREWEAFTALDESLARLDGGQTAGDGEGIVAENLSTGETRADTRSEGHSRTPISNASPAVCPTCQGEELFIEYHVRGSRRTEFVQTPCPSCGGTGKAAT